MPRVITKGEARLFRERTRATLTVCRKLESELGEFQSWFVPPPYVRADSGKMSNSRLKSSLYTGHMVLGVYLFGPDKARELRPYLFTRLGAETSLSLLDRMRLICVDMESQAGPGAIWIADRRKSYRLPNDGLKELLTDLCGLVKQFSQSPTMMTE